MALVAALVGVWGLVATRDRPSPSLAHAENATSPPTARLPPSPPEPLDRRIPPEVTRQWTALEAREAEAAATVWATEQAADACTAVVDAFWDRLNAAPNRLRHLETLAVPRMEVPTWDLPRNLTHGIQELAPTLPVTTWDPVGWREAVSRWAGDGWRLLQVELRHVQFDPATHDLPARSVFRFSAHLERSAPLERATLEGPLRLEWRTVATTNAASPPELAAIDATRLVMRRRSGPPPFVPALEAVVRPPPRGQSIDPLIVEDLDGDGFPEILLVARNQVFRRQPDGTYLPETLCTTVPDAVYTAVLADFDGDGHRDLLSLGFIGLQLFPGGSDGRFLRPPRLVWKTGSTLPLEFPMVLTCGDVDRDGDLDVFLGQYRDPYEGGSVPTPYYRATNGHPSYLLLNQGPAPWSDVTASAGLGPHRHRRIYSASLVDLDQDTDLDLVTVSDFAGLDLYRNDGTGRFTAVTESWVHNPYGFGMAHALADFDADGLLDLLMIGMSSPTVDRLEHLGLFRGGIPGDREHRAAMAHGNRLYQGRAAGGFEETDLGISLARSGWSWGCAAADFDNDGRLDVHIVNGLESRQSVREYEAEYWRHDLFVGTAQDDPAALLYFKAKNARTRGRGMSYGGYEKNRLYLGTREGGFLEFGHLLGVALEADSRNAVATDLDGDGKVDLIVTSFEAWPEPKQVLRIFRNTLEAPGHWIGLRFEDDPALGSPQGTRVVVRHAGRSRAAALVTGDSHRSQHPTTLHFGLGESSSLAVEEVEVRWPDSSRSLLKQLAADQVHPVRRKPAENR